MPMDRVASRGEAISKAEFHRRLRRWLDETDDAIAGAEDVVGPTPWVHVRDGVDLFVLHADTPRSAIERYLLAVSRHGDSLPWEIVESRKGKMTKVAYGPEGTKDDSFYFYAAR